MTYLAASAFGQPDGSVLMLFVMVNEGTDPDRDREMVEIRISQQVARKLALDIVSALRLADTGPVRS